MATSLKGYKDFKDKAYGLKEISDFDAAKEVYNELNNYYKLHKTHVTAAMRMAYERDLKIAKSLLEKIPKSPALKKSKTSPTELVKKLTRKILEPKVETAKTVPQKSKSIIDPAILNDLWLGNEPVTSSLTAIPKTDPVVGKGLKQKAKKIFEEIEELVEDWKHKQNQEKRTAKDKPLLIVSKNKLSINIEEIRDKIKLLIKDSSHSIKFAETPDTLVITKKNKSLMTVTSQEIKANAVHNDIRDYKLMLRAALALYQKPLIIYLPESERLKLEAAAKIIGLKKSEYKITHNPEEYKTKQEMKPQEFLNPPSHYSQEGRDFKTPEYQ
jgi:hypothetical protein